jgi:hypothetical protein
MTDAEREVRVTVNAPDHLSLTEIAEMFWDKLDRPDSVFTVDAIAVSTTAPKPKVLDA